MESNEVIARNSIEWRDDDKLSFLWEGQLVLLYYNRESGRSLPITTLDPEKGKKALLWLDKFLGSYLDEYGHLDFNNESDMENE